MNNRYGLSLLAAVLLALGGCASVKSPVPVETTTAPAEAPTAGAPVATPGAEAVPAQAAEPAPLEPVPIAGMSGNVAVVALLNRAEADSKAGEREAAGALLERALRIEPRNPWLWNQLAQLRLAQGQYAQAITLARKSNSFGGKQIRLQAGNWQVIGQARSAQGDTVGAEQALQRSADLAQQVRDAGGFR